MSVVSGKATFSSTGAKTLYLGIDFVDLDFYAGPRDGVTETNQLLAIGHADAGKQFCHSTKDGKSSAVQNKAMRAYDAAGNVVLEFDITGGWGTPFMNANVTVANINYPFEVKAKDV